MGAKVPAVLKSRNKCNFCSRILPSLSSLRAHQLSVHPASLKEKEKRMVTRSMPPMKKKDVGVGKKKILKDPVKESEEETEEESPSPPKKVQIIDEKMLKTPEKLDISHLEDKECTIAIGAKPKVTFESVVASVKQNFIPKSQMKEVKVEFKCPKCNRSPYSTFFSAIRHIQKMHCVDRFGNPVAPDDPNLIKPIRIEPCSYCDEKIKSSKPHNCPNSRTDDFVQLENTEMICLGCHLKFSNPKFFDLHLSGKHQDGFDAMFFNNTQEVEEWLEFVEKSTHNKYRLVSKSSNKKTYRCTHTAVPPESDKNLVICVCPSTIMVQEFSKGTQVSFYKQHGGHLAEKYRIIYKYRRYLITSIIDKTAKPTRFDLCFQFKKLMERIIAEVDKANIQDLRCASEKALELAAALNINDTDLRVVTSNLKYASSGDESEPAAKRPRRKSKLIERNVTPSQPKTIVNSFSLADDKHTDKLLKELETDVKSTPVNKSTASLLLDKDRSPSFNDSYQQFVSTLKPPNTKAEKTKPILLRKKTVKTKTEQLKPSPEKSEASSIEKKRLSLGKREIEYEVKERENDCNILVLKI